MNSLIFKTKLGNILISEKGGKLTECLFTTKKVTTTSNRFLQKAKKEIELYLAGKLKSFSIPMDLSGTKFQLKVWKTLMKIPYGETVSYKDIGLKLNSKAYRAIGSANGANQICIIVPCHRVITSSGKLGGYTGGLSKKEGLLKVEGISVPSR